MSFRSQGIEKIWCWHSATSWRPGSVQSQFFWHARSWMVTQKKMTQFSLALTYEALLQSSQQTAAVLLCVYPRLTSFWIPELSHLYFLQSKASGIIQVCAACTLTNHSPENIELSTPSTFFPPRIPSPFPPEFAACFSAVDNSSKCWI